MTLPLLDSLALAVTRVVTGVLPLSSSGHSALVALLFGVELAPRVELSVAVGTWAGIAVFFRERWVPVLTSLRWGGTKTAALPGLGRTLAMTTLAWVAVGLAVHGAAVAFAKDPGLVGGGLLVTALAAGATLWAPEGDRDLPSTWGAVLVGAVQGVAVLPGLSRPALALAALLLLGLRPARAFELCFLAALPSELALGVLGAFAWSPPMLARSLAGVGTVLALSALVAPLAFALLRLLEGIVTRRLLPVFALYLVPLGVATMAWTYARP